ncbi:MAG: ribosome biogenesis GTPase Der [Flavobacteriales bacterium]|nr:ribosome biogenesis GTPase Der [Flavobacteriales bacterium]
MANIVAIVGRPNVGKSTLFNRLTESRDAIVDPTEGVTRDRHYGKSLWNGHEFSVIDTGGYIHGSEDVFEEEIRKQVKLAIEEANVILFVVDVMAGVTDMDQEVADMLRKSKKKIFLVANKVDTSDKAAYAAEFYRFGLGEIFSLSAQNGSGTGELLDEITKDFVHEEEDENPERLPRIAIVGKPNVGKSSLLNALTGQERNIVTPISGTTRDSIHTHYKAFGFDFDLIDTAGIRKKAKVQEDIEFYSVLRSIRTIEESDVCLFMIDAAEGLQKQDLNIYYLVESNKKGVVVLVNKWDLVEKDTKTLKQFEENLRSGLAPFNDVPIIFISALTKQRIHKALEEAMRVYNNRARKIPTSKLNEALLPIVEQNPPPSYKGKYIKIKYITQLPTEVPSFAFFCNLPQYIKDPYKRYLENQLRKIFDFEGVPVRIFFRQK